MQSMQFAQAFAEPLALNANNFSQKPSGEPAPESPRYHRTHKPAIFSAGRRRRIVRRSAAQSSSTPNSIPRSGTLPDMRIAPTPKSATSSLVSSTAAAFASAPTQGRPATSTPTKTKGARGVPAYATPPRPRATEGKKKAPSFLGVFKAKELNNSLPDGALSPKARKVLGLPAAACDENGNAANGSHDSEGEFSDSCETDDETHSSSGRITRDVPARTNTDDIKSVQPAFPYAPGPATESATSLTKKRSNKKALRMLDLLPTLGTRPKSSGSDGPKNSGSDSRTPSGSSDGTQDSKLAYHSEGDQITHFGVSRVDAKIRKRRLRRRGKAIEHMSPITERSSNSSRSDAELDVIREYDRVRRSLTMPLIPRIELDGDTPREEDELEYDTEVESGAHGVSDFARSGISLALGEQHAHVPGLVPAMIMQQFRGLCQESEPGELIEREGLLLHGLGHNETERIRIAAQHNRLREEHERLKADLAKATGHLHASNDSSMSPDFPSVDGCETLADEPELNHESDSDSGFDSDDGSCMHVAQAIPFRRVTSEMVKLVEIRRVTPGMVKSIDIPPKNPKRYEHPVDIDFAEVRALNDQYQADLEREVLCEKVGTPVPANARPSPGPRQLSAGVPSVRGGRPLALDPHHPYSSSSFAYAKEKKAKLPREASRNLVEGWIQTASTDAQRPVSLLVDTLRLDPDVLADQNLDRPPAPPPKDASRANAQISHRHFCVNVGHLFREIDLQQAPDNIAVNSLEVSPYLRTRTGVMQHVRIPVMCERCGRDVNEKFYECEIPVCRLSVCASCAVDMQATDEERAIQSWNDHIGN